MFITRQITLSSFVYALTLTKSSFEKIYRDEDDVKTKERMLLVLNVVYYSMVAAHVASDLHRNRAWACVWLKRYDKEGVVGLKNKPRTGRPSAELSEEDISAAYKRR